MGRRVKQGPHVDHPGFEGTGINGSARNEAAMMFTSNDQMQESEISNFWNEHPCGESFVGGIGKFGADYERFFADYDDFRYSKEAHILDCLDKINFSGKRTLEIGLGQGADAEQLIRRGADWFGLDLTGESVRRVQLRMNLRTLPFGVAQGSILSIPYAANAFDIVFSHGVLHHVPEIITAQHELHRVLKPDGELIVMLYAKHSLNYLLSIAVIRRFGLIGAFIVGSKPGGIIGNHVENARKTGLWNYLKLKNFTHRNTDGPMNPYAKVYDVREVERDFPSFYVEKTYKRFMHAPPLPVKGLPFEKYAGWHLWVHLRPR